jgi:hypothetical protein
MKNMREFDNILNECIERVFRGEPIEACLKAFPQHAAELEPLLRTAIDTHKAAEISPRPEFRQRAGYEFQTAIRDMKPDKKSLFMRQIRWVTALSVILVILMAGSGTLAASADSLPDESLYGIKLFTEEVRLALTTSKTAKAELYAEFVDTRVEEIIKMADKGNAEQVAKTTGLMNNSLVSIAKITQPARTFATATGQAPQSSDAESLTAAAAMTPGTTQNDTAAKAPAVALKPATASASLSARSVTSNMSKTAAIQKADEKTRESTQARINTTVSKQAEQNTKDLQEALKRAPDSVKPALEKAIEVAEKGYDEALSNRDKNKK